MDTTDSPEPSILVIFGGTGDLARRKLLPALGKHALAGALSERTQVVGVAQNPANSEATFRALAQESIGETIEAQELGSPQHGPREAQDEAMGQDHRESEPAQEAPPQAPRALVLERAARELHHGSELHAGGAHALAVAAQQAEIHLVGEDRVGRQPLLRNGAHEVDSAARAGGLLARQAEGRTGLEAQTAMDAVQALGVVDQVRPGFGSFLRRLARPAVAVGGLRATHRTVRGRRGHGGPASA